MGENFHDWGGVGDIFQVIVDSKTCGEALPLPPHGFVGSEVVS